VAKHSYTDHLRKVTLFSDLDAKELDAVGRAATELDLKAGSVLMRQGKRAHEMFVLTKGTVEISKDGTIVAEVGPGGFVGEMALLTNAHRNATVTAKTDVEVIHLDGRAFGALLRDVPQIAVKMLPIVAARLLEAESATSDGGS
jgi:CRP/FNR family cyclic AMP-dependent transcriptional regulator